MTDKGEDCIETNDTAERKILVTCIYVIVDLRLKDHRKTGVPSPERSKSRNLRSENVRQLTTIRYPKFVLSFVAVVLMLKHNK